MDGTIRLALETISLNKQAIVFVASRSSAEKTAEDIAKLIDKKDNYLFSLAEKISKIVSPPTKQCKRLSSMISKGVAFHHAGLTNKQKEIIEKEFRAGTVKIICATPTLAAGLSLPAFRVILKSLKRYSGRWGMNWIPVLEYLQMAGRAGRPEYEKFGEAIAIAKNDKDKEEIHERYICGEAEDIYSKLAVEPVLRMYLLSLISSGIIKDEKEMKEFFKETFWASQFKDFDKLEEIMDKMLNLLHEWEFVKVEGKGEICEHNDERIGYEISDKKIYQKDDKGLSDFIIANSLLNKIKKSKKVEKEGNINRKLKPTLIGKRVSQLYLDPLTAKHLIDCIKKAEMIKETNSFSYLQMISNTLEMRPLLTIRVKDRQEVQEILLQNYDTLLSEEPDTYDLDYPEFMKSLKTAAFFEAWINEKSENFLFETYNVRPGEIRVKLENANWLLYSCYELAELLSYKEISKDLRKLRVRVKNGVKEELLVLLKLKGVGRVRARKLYNNGVKTLSDLKRIDSSSLSQLLGKKLATNVKSVLGEEIKEVPKGKRTRQLSLEKF